MRPVIVSPGCTAAKTCSCAGKGCVELGDLPAGRKEVVTVYHDECICAANEGRGSYWGSKGDRFFRKSKGSSIMISGFICPCHGRMEIPPDQVAPFEAFVRKYHDDIPMTKSRFDLPDGSYGYESFTTRPCPHPTRARSW